MKTLTGKEYGDLFSEPVDGPLRSYPIHLTEPPDIVLPKRNLKYHKYSFGRALIIGGSTEYSGAPTLAANACERSGAGLTRLMVPESIHTIAAIKADGTVERTSNCSGAFKTGKRLRDRTWSRAR